MFCRVKNIFWIAIFLLGLICGTLYVNYTIEQDNVLNTGEKLFSQDLFGETSENNVNRIHIVTKRIILFAFLAGSALLYGKNLLLYISTAFFGGCFGVVISVVTLTYANAGIQKLFWCLMPHYLFYIAAFCVVLELSDCKGKVYKKYRYMLKSVDGKRLFLKLFLLVLAGIMSECYVNQWIIQHFVKKI